MSEIPVNEGQGQVVAAPSGVENNTGADNTSVDESGSNIIVGDAGEGDEATSGIVNQGEDGDVPGAVKEQSAEANKAFAEMRKQKESAEKAAQKARDDFQKQRDSEFAKRFGDSHGIFTEQQYWAAMDREQKQRTEQAKQQQAELPKQLYADLIAKGYDPKVAESIADGLATKLELQQLKQEREAEKKVNQEQQTKAQQEAQREKTAKQIMTDHEALSKKYGELVPSLDDMDEATIDLMKQGIPLKAAWLTAHEDDVIEFAKNNGAKKMAKNVSSKAHLQSEKSGAGDFGTQIELSAGQISAYRNLFGSKMTIAEMKKREAAFRKRGK